MHAHPPAPRQIMSRLQNQNFQTTTTTRGFHLKARHITNLIDRRPLIRGCSSGETSDQLLPSAWAHRVNCQHMRCDSIRNRVVRAKLNIRRRLLRQMTFSQRSATVLSSAQSVLCKALFAKHIIIINCNCQLATRQRRHDMACTCNWDGSDEKQKSKHATGWAFVSSHHLLVSAPHQLSCEVR